MIFILFLLIPPTRAQAEAKLRLSPKTVAQMVLTKSFRSSEIEDQFKMARLAQAVLNAKFDWQMSLGSAYEYDRSEMFYPLPSIPGAKYNRYTTDLDMQKSFSSGTTLDVEYMRLSQKAYFDLGATNPFGILPSETQDRLGLKVEQSLLRNFFGRADRAALHAAALDYASKDLMRASRLEDLVLKSLHLFWNAYVAQESFQEALQSRDRYKTLVGQVRRKLAEGYGNPGELAQAQAEFESQVQNVKLRSLEYVGRLGDLTTLLNLPADTDLDFDVDSNVPPVPKLTPVELKSLRKIKAQTLRLEAARENLTAARSENYPDLRFIGKASTSGLDEDANSSLSAMTAGSHPEYFGGLQLTYRFGSGVEHERVVSGEAEEDLEKTKLEQAKLKQLEQLAQAERTVEAQYAVVQSTLKQKDLRQKAAHQLNRSYNMGRTDIRLLIDAINDQYDTEVKFWRAVGDYQIALNEWAAKRDELIPQAKGEK